jgi:hypothetical protein
MKLNYQKILIFINKMGLHLKNQIINYTKALWLINIFFNLECWIWIVKMNLIYIKLLRLMIRIKRLKKLIKI